MASFGTLQYSIECDSCACSGVCHFYCNSCYISMCEKCKDEHLTNSLTKFHDVVLYQQRLRRLQMDKCRAHPMKIADICCKECDVPVCSKCTTTPQHKSHTFIDLETICTERFHFYQKKSSDIHKYYIPESQEVKDQIETDIENLEIVSAEIRNSMYEENENLKQMADFVLSENIKSLCKIEDKLRQEMENQHEIIDNYILHLKSLLGKYRRETLAEDINGLITFQRQKSTIEIPSIPKTRKLDNFPTFDRRYFTKYEIAELLGEVRLPQSKYHKRVISTFDEIQRQEIDEINDRIPIVCKTKKKLTQSRLISAIQITEFAAPEGISPWHISRKTPKHTWISDISGILTAINAKGTELFSFRTQTITECNYGFHASTQDGDLMFINGKFVSRMTCEASSFRVIQLIHTEDWTASSVYSSNINGDVLVGMIKGEEGQVTRYDQKGHKLSDIPEVFLSPNYITENINGNVCVSDLFRRALIVTDTFGEQRFIYEGKTEAWFLPNAVVTDILGHIIVCDGYENTVHLLESDGQFLRLFPQAEDRFVVPRGLYIDLENNLFVGNIHDDSIIVFKYLEEYEI